MFLSELSQLHTNPFYNIQNDRNRRMGGTIALNIVKEQFHRTARSQISTLLTQGQQSAAQ
jgi:hypothetical protein